MKTNNDEIYNSEIFTTLYAGIHGQFISDGVWFSFQHLVSVEHSRYMIYTVETRQLL